MNSTRKFVVRGVFAALISVAAAGCQQGYLNPGNPPTSPSGLPTPFIVSLSPTSGRVGSAVTIAGLNFGAAQGASSVMFGNSAATPTSWAANSIVVTVPNGASGTVIVNAGGLPSNSVSFTVTP